MSQHLRGRCTRTILVAAVIAVLAPAAPAAAHDPLFLTATQSDPESGPLLPDGTISFALYGVLDAPRATRGFQVQMTEGAPLLVDLLIPDLEPERSLLDSELPTVTVRAPDGTEATLQPDARVPFPEPFTRTDYLRLARLEAPAQAGVYDVTVTGTAPSRFTVAVGSAEQFGTPVGRVESRLTDFTQINDTLQRWYATPPPAVPAGTVVPTTVPPTAAPTTDGDAVASRERAAGDSAAPWIAAGAVVIGALVGAAVLVARSRKRSHSNA